jgi:acyl dehydratase
MAGAEIRGRLGPETVACRMASSFTMPDMAPPTIHIDRISESYEGRIDEDAAVAYALATNDPNDVYVRGDGVPPLYTASLIHAAFGEASRRGMDPGAIRDGRNAVHGEHEVFLTKPLRPGMAVQWRAGTVAARQTPAGVIVTHRIVVSDTEGTPYVEHLWSSLHVGGVIDSDVGRGPVDHTFPADARDRLLGTHLFEVTRDQGFRYAGASGDRNPHCVDDEAARREGFPSKILQGLCTLAMCSGAVVKIGADGDPDQLRRIVGRFSSPVFPPDQVVVEVFDAGRTADGGRALAFEATANGVMVVRHGRAELNPS